MKYKSMSSALSVYFLSKAREMHTIKPGVVVAVNGATVDVKVLTGTGFRDGSVVYLPVLREVPLFVLGGGGCRITFPVRQGDKVIVLFSDRDYGSLLGSTEAEEPFPPENPTPFGIYPILALPEFYLNGNTEELDDRNVSIEAEEVKITIEPGGRIVMSGQTEVVMKSKLTVENDLVVGGGAEVTKEVKAADLVTEVASFNTHTHLYSPGPGSPTDSAPPTPEGP